jgi:glycosyltransferase involved in cell wall biosynthesis
MGAPLVTIGVTAYNAAATIRRAIQSALAQEGTTTEVIVVDDGSIDETPQILSGLVSQSPFMKVFRNDINLGVAASRNRILEIAQGSFVAFFDDDDESLPERVITQLGRILAYENRFADGAPVICHTARLLVFPTGSRQLAPTMGEDDTRTAPAGKEVAERILLGKKLRSGYGSCATCSQMGRLSTYRLVGGFDPSFRRSEDTELSIRLALQGVHFIGVRRPLVIQYMTKSHKKNLSEEYRYHVLLLNKHREIFHQGQFEFSRAWIEAKQAWLESRRAAFARSLLALFLSHPILSFRRLVLSLPNIGLNRAFRHHLRGSNVC